MATVKARPNQSMLNLVLMACGTVEGAMAFCAANGVSISDNPVVDREYVVPDNIATNKANLQYLKDNKVVLANADLGVCTVPGGVDVVEGSVTFDSASIAFTVPDDAVGMEWGISLKTEDAPAEWIALALDAETISILDLEPLTSYRAYVRTLCWGNESKPATVEFTTAAPPALEHRILLKPVMDVVPDMGAGAPGTVGLYRFEVVGAPEFEHLYDLFPNYPSDNKVYYETEERIILMYPSQNDVPTAVLPTTDLNIPYELHYTDGLGYMIVWSDLTAPYKTTTFQDVEGNEAYYAPVWAFDNVSQALISKVCAELLIEQVSATYEQVVLRLTRSHPDSIALGGGFGPPDMKWVADALSGTADPDDPLNTDKVLLTLTPGTYTVGVKTNYASPRPSSIFTIVIEVYSI